MSGRFHHRGKYGHDMSNTVVEGWDSTQFDYQVKLLFSGEAALAESTFFVDRAIYLGIQVGSRRGSCSAGGRIVHPLLLAAAAAHVPLFLSVRVLGLSTAREFFLEADGRVEIQYLLNGEYRSSARAFMKMHVTLGHTP